MRIALPKGRLFTEVYELLKRAGFNFEFRSERDYRPVCGNTFVDAKLLKPRAIPQLLALGLFDVGFCGLDLIADADYENVVPLLDLGFSRVELVVAVPRGKEDFLRNPPKRPILIATEYEHLADKWALKHNLAHIIMQTYGSTEAYAPEDADIIFDCFETGKTIEANGLVVVEEIMTSATCLAVSESSLKDSVKESAIKEMVKMINKGGQNNG